MAAFNFPNSPSVNDQYTANGVTFKWNGTIWQRISASSGAQGTTGSAGPTGAQGAAAGLTISTSAPGSPSAGDMWWDSDAGLFLTYYNDGNSSQWVEINQGPKGAQGATGPTGAQGATGSGGSTGSTGAQGATGSTGAQGATGSTGAQGATGSTGAQGSAGAQGAAGNTTTMTVADESSDTDCYPLFVTTTTGNLAPKTGTNLVFNSASGNLRSGSLFVGTGSNESKIQDGLILERNSGDGECHITAGRSGGNYGGMQFYVAGASGVTKRYGIDYQSNFRWYHANGTTERLKLDTYGALTSTASNNGQIIHSFKNTDTTAGSSAMTVEHWFRFNRSGGGMDSPAAKIIAGKEREWIGGASNQDGYLAFHTLLNESSAEKVRINSLGDLLINQTTTNDSRLSIKARSSAVDFINCRDSSNTLKFYVHSSGNTYNTNGNYSQISDQSLKENIVDANSQWNDIKNIKIRNFNFTEESGMETHTQIGCVAQEVETVSPKLVTAPRADGIKTVANSVLYMKAVKALQEAMTRIETLESKVAALEGS